MGILVSLLTSWIIRRSGDGLKPFAGWIAETVIVLVLAGCTLMRCNTSIR